MKRILLLVMLLFAGAAFAQPYPSRNSASSFRENLLKTPPSAS